MSISKVDYIWLYFFRIITRGYLKLRFVSNTFWTKIPKSRFCEPNAYEIKLKIKQINGLT